MIIIADQVVVVVVEVDTTYNIGLPITELYIYLLIHTYTLE